MLCCPGALAAGPGKLSAPVLVRSLHYATYGFVKDSEEVFFRAYRRKRY